MITLFLTTTVSNANNRAHSFSHIIRYPRSYITSSIHYHWSDQNIRFHQVALIHFPYHCIHAEPDSDIYLFVVRRMGYMNLPGSRTLFLLLSCIRSPFSTAATHLRTIPKRAKRNIHNYLQHSPLFTDIMPYMYGIHYSSQLGGCPFNGRRPLSGMKYPTRESPHRDLCVPYYI